MRAILIRDSRVEAALLRLDRWWSGLTTRERIMVSVLGTLLGLVVLVYGVVKPVQAARAEARADIRTYETLNARIRAAGRLTAATPRREGTPEQIVAGAAQGLGLTVTSTAIPGGARASVNDVPYDKVLGWIAEVGRSSTLGVTRVEIVRKPTPGLIAATVEFGE